jgi:hypothetical protein
MLPARSGRNSTTRNLRSVELPPHRIKYSNPLLLESLIGMLFLVLPQHWNRFQDTQRIIFALLLLMGNVVEGQVVAITSWRKRALTFT